MYCRCWDLLTSVTFSSETGGGLRSSLDRSISLPLLKDEHLSLVESLGGCTWLILLLLNSCSSWRIFATISSLFDFWLSSNSLRGGNQQHCIVLKWGHVFLSTERENTHTLQHGVGVEDIYVAKERRGEKRTYCCFRLVSSSCFFWYICLILLMPWASRVAFSCLSCCSFFWAFCLALSCWTRKLS